MQRQPPTRPDVEAILFDLGGVLVELSGVDQMLGWSTAVGNTDELWQRTPFDRASIRATHASPLRGGMAQSN